MDINEDEINPTESYISTSLCMPLNLIHFVAEKELTDYAEPSTSNKTSNVKLDGKEISKFYKNLVSDPSVKTQEQINQNQINKSSLKSEKRCNSNKTDKNRENSNKSLHYLAQHGNIDEIRELVSSGADLNIKDAYGWTPLMCAASACHIGIIKYLLECGADYNIETPQGLRALDIAMKQDCPPEILELLIKPHQLGRVKKQRTSKQSVSKANKNQKLHFCKVCKKEYRDHPKSHERSIAHLLILNKSNADKTFYHIPECNKGYQMMLKNGWDTNKGLGPISEGRKYPIKTILKRDRCCIGRTNKEKSRITHFGPHDVKAVELAPWERRKLNLQCAKSLKKQELDKLQKKNKQKEIAFRQYYNIDL